MKIEEEIAILENALKGALLVPSECTFVSSEVIKICLDTLKTYESWENLIRYEIEEEIRADEKSKILDEVRNALIEKADYMETEEGFYGKVVTEKEIEEIIKSLKE